MAYLQLRLLGTFHAELAGQPLTAFRSNRSRALLAYLAVEAGYPHSRQALAALLWGDYPEARAQANLRMTLLNLRQTLDISGASQPLLTITRQSVQLKADPALMGLDVNQFDRLLAACEAHPHQVLWRCSACIERLSQAMALYRGDFLTGLALTDMPAFGEWRLHEQEKRHQQALLALDTLTRHGLALRNYDQAQAYARRQLLLEPWLEKAHRQLMQALAWSGQPAAALAQYQACRYILAEELGAYPAAETVALVEQIQAGELSSGAAEQGGSGELFSPAPPLPRSPAPRHNLPQPATPFVGREVELGQLEQKLFDPAYRLVTVVGMGGVGKTRLALAAAGRLLAHFADGVWFVPLVSVASAKVSRLSATTDLLDMLAAAISTALNLVFYGMDTPRAQLLNYLRAKELLLILDNFEYLVEGAGLLSDIIQQAPPVKLLVTSQERLSLAEESLIEIGGLPFPPLRPALAHPLPAPTTQSELLTYSAVALFTQQARRVRPDFDLYPLEWPYTARICQLVEGVPLGLELAASWLRVFSCAQIATEIERDLDFLTTSLRNVPARQRNLRAVFEHSWRLLSPEEQRVFSQLSIFRGGFGPDAAQQVAQASPWLLADLIDKSLLRRTASGRYEMHELLRLCAAEKLAQWPAEQEAAQTRHCRHYAELVHRHENLLENRQEAEALAQLDLEADNIRAGWRWALAPHRPVAAAEIALSAQGARRFYERRGWFQEGMDLFQRALDRLEQAAHLPGSPAPAVIKLAYGRVLGQQGVFYWYMERFEQAEAYLQKSISALQGLEGTEPDQNLAYRFMGVIARYRKAYSQAEQYFQAGLSLLSLSDDPVSRAKSVGALGVIACDQGNYVKAEQLLNQSLAVLKPYGELRYTTYVLQSLGETYKALGRTEEAHWVLPGLQEIVTAHRHSGDLWMVASTLNKIGRVAYVLDRDAEAWQSLGEALETAAKLQVIPLILDILSTIATLLVRQDPTLSTYQHPTLNLLTLTLTHPDSSQRVRRTAADLLAKLKPNLSPDIEAVLKKEGNTQSLESMVTTLLSMYRQYLHS